MTLAFPKLVADAREVDHFTQAVADLNVVLNMNGMVPKSDEDKALRITLQL